MKSVQWVAMGCVAGVIAATALSASAADATKSVTPTTQSAPTTQSVPKPASTVPAAPSGATPEMKALAKAKDEERKAAMRAEPTVDINNAPKAEIAKVLQISDADAGKIVAARPLRSRTEIVTKAGLPEGVYHAVRHRIVINEPRKQKSAPKK